MANLVGIVEEVDGARNLRMTINIEGDGSTVGVGVEERVPIAEAALKSCDTFRLDRVHAIMNGFDAYLEWDGPSPVRFMHIPDGVEVQEGWRSRGGVNNPKVANYTGDLNLVLVDLGASEQGSMSIDLVKKGT